MDIIQIEAKAEELAQKFNPEGLSPFPFEKITEEYPDLVINESNNLPDGVSGAISCIKENENVRYTILINNTKHKNRQYFTIAHELGHYFLHLDIIDKEEILIDDESFQDNLNTLFRTDDAQTTKIETEANRFAASLIMPKSLVINAWNELKNIEACANAFNVSVVAMSIRLEKLKLLN